MDVNIRLGEDGDRAALGALRRAWVEENAGTAILDEDFEDAFASWYAAEKDQRIVWVAESGGLLVGMLNVLVFRRMPRPGITPTLWGYLANFYVAPEHRGGGVGTLLLRACTTYADEHGFVRIVLSPSARSVPLYEREGFAPATALMLRPGPGS